MNFLNKFFKLEERGTTIGREIIGGIIIFLAMIYILPTNSGILSVTGMDYGGVFMATALAAGISTIIMGLFANYPVGLAAGMGLNALFAFTICGPIGKMGLTWQEGLACVLISGIIFLIISLTGLREAIIKAIPKNLKIAVSAGIGGFIAYVGLIDIGVIGFGAVPGISFSSVTGIMVLGILGIVLAFILHSLNHKISRFAVIISMVATAVVGLIIYGIMKGTNNVNAALYPHFDSVATISNLFNGFKDVFGGCFKGFKTVFTKPEAYACIFTFLFVDFFDTAGTLVGVGTTAGLVDEETGELKGGKRALLADSIGTVLGAVCGTTTVTSFIESSTGVESGARTGLAACVTGVLFLLSIFAYPVFSIFSNSVTIAMALVLVGALMFGQLKNLDWNDKIAVAAGFLIVFVITLGYSISDGIAVGFIMYVLMMICAKRYKEVSPILYATAALLLVYLIVRVLCM